MTTEANGPQKAISPPEERAVVPKKTKKKIRRRGPDKKTADARVAAMRKEKERTRDAATPLQRNPEVPFSLMHTSQIEEYLSRDIHGMQDARYQHVATIAEVVEGENILYEKPHGNFLEDEIVEGRWPSGLDYQVRLVHDGRGTAYHLLKIADAKRYHGNMHTVTIDLGRARVVLLRIDLGEGNSAMPWTNTDPKVIEAIFTSENGAAAFLQETMDKKSIQ